jgi:hypothetical protein
MRIATAGGSVPERSPSNQTASGPVPTDLG